MFKKFAESYLYILIYIVIAAVTVIRIFGFEQDFKSDVSKAANLKDCKVECIVTSIPKISDDYLTFNARITDGLKLKNYAHIELGYAQNLEVCLGDTITLTGKIFSTPMPLNPGGYSYGKYLKSQGVSVVIKSNIYNISKHSHSALIPLYAARGKITENAFLYMPQDEASVVNALVTGSKDEMTESLKETFRRAGVYHIIAISGLHLNLIIMFLSVLYLGFRANSMLKKLVAFLVTFLGCGFVLVFTGLGISVQRAAIMAIVLCIAAFCQREYSPTASLFAAFVIILNISPSAYLDTSFQLSFSATAGILFALEIINRYDFDKYPYPNLIKSVILTTCANIFTLPFLIMTFGRISLVSVVSNLVIAPITAFLLGMSYLFGIASLVMPPAICKLIANITVVPAFAMNFASSVFSKIPFSYVEVTTTLLCTALALAIGCFIVAKSKKYKLTLCAVFVIANMFFVSYNVYKEDCNLTFVSVGQGDCALINDTKGTAIMIDCGSESHSSISADEVIPYIRRQGIYKIDALVLTHFHTDHTNGIFELIDRGYLKSVILPDRLPSEDETENAKKIYDALVSKGIPIHHISQGDTLTVNSKHKFRVLSPDEKYNMSANNSSLVLEYSYDKKRVLFTADIEEEAMYPLLNILKSYDITKVSHHGGKNTLNSSFAQKISGKYAVISCGKDNRYNHPHKDTLKAFKDFEILRTDLKGPIQFSLKEDN